ncbi:MAG: SAM-dependent methyltransferase [Clostridiales bacterium]|nr:SAM-dependent methyltransferase [Clostridiales bacterium]
MFSVRLNKLVSLLPTCDLLADVGCDHGYVGIEALRLGKAQRVAFTDISQPSLDKARDNCPQEFNSVVSFYCQDGLGAIEADCVIIAGMGGLEIISILSNAQHLPPQLVLQPMRNQRDVRKYLTQKYEIVTDVKFHDGKFYDVIVAKQCDKPSTLTELELEFGKSNLQAPSDDFVNFLQLELKKLNKILEGTSDAEVTAKRDVVQQTLNIILKKIK